VQKPNTLAKKKTLIWGAGADSHGREGECPIEEGSIKGTGEHQRGDLKNLRRKRLAVCASKKGFTKKENTPDREGQGGAVQKCVG